MVPQVHRKTRTARWTRGHSSTKLAHQRCRRTRNGRYVQPHRPDACARPCTLARTHARTHEPDTSVTLDGSDLRVGTRASHRLHRTAAGWWHTYPHPDAVRAERLHLAMKKKPMTYSDTAQVPVVTRLTRVRSGTRRLYWQRRGSVEWNAAL